jgi:hypothetical protein
LEIVIARQVQVTEPLLLADLPHLGAEKFGCQDGISLRGFGKSAQETPENFSNLRGTGGGLHLDPEPLFLSLRGDDVGG